MQLLMTFLERSCQIKGNVSIYKTGIPADSPNRTRLVCERLDSRVKFISYQFISKIYQLPDLAGQKYENVSLSRKKFPVPKTTATENARNHTFYGENMIPCDVCETFQLLGQKVLEACKTLPFSEDCTKKCVSTSAEKRRRLLKTERNKKKYALRVMFPYTKQESLLTAQTERNMFVKNLTVD